MERVDCREGRCLDLPRLTCVSPHKQFDFIGWDRSLAPWIAWVEIVLSGNDKQRVDDAWVRVSVACIKSIG